MITFVTGSFPGLTEWLVRLMQGEEVLTTMFSYCKLSMSIRNDIDRVIERLRLGRGNNLADRATPVALFAR